jgi:hypothetical protein
LARPHLTIILLVWLAAVLALSAVIPQSPPRIDDPVVRSQWLASVPSAIRPVVERWQVLGVFNLLDSAWLRLPLALWLAHCLIVLADVGPRLWRRVRWASGEIVSLGRSFQLSRDLSGSVAEVGPQLAGRLEKAGYHVRHDEDQGHLVAWKRRWGWLGLAGIYLGLGAAATGLLLQGWLGRAQDVRLEPGDPVPAPELGILYLALEDVSVAGGDPLQPAAGTVSLSMVSGVGESQLFGLRLHGSRLLRGRWWTLTGLTPVAEVTAVNTETGQSVPLQPFYPRTPAQDRVRLPLTGDPETRFVGVPSENVTLNVNYQADSAPAPDGDRPAGPAFSLSFYRRADPEPTQSELLSSDEQATFDAVRYLVTFDYDAALRIHSALWWLAVAIGWTVAAASFIVLVIAPPIYARANLEARGRDSRVWLTVDTLGEGQGRQIEFQAIITPDV